MHTRMWSDMFVLGLPLAEKILRPVAIYIFLVVGLRLAGKRELAQLNPFDLVVLLTLSNTVQNAIIGDDNSVTGGILGASTLLALNYVVVRFLYSHKKLERVVEGASDVLVDKGKIQARHLKKELLTRAELEAAAHRQGFGSLDEIDEAVLEPTGIVSFTSKKPAPDEARHGEVMARLDQITRELAQLRQAPSPGQA
ncbi:MAG TPA: YetF domain-containing protein [Terriglobia bacterium]|nr:YetF domain-containing protein [Terriglobia bacterium]